MTSVPKVIDVELALQEKIPDIYKKIPGVLIRLMEKVIRQADMNRMIHESSHLNGIPLVDWVLDQFGVNIVLSSKSSHWRPRWSGNSISSCKNSSADKIRSQ